jgi:lipopolysaccharide transport system permease protein
MALLKIPWLFTMISSTFNALKYGWKTRRVWWFTSSARTRERFARTTLGSFWLGFSNLLSIGILAVVYGTVFKVPDFNEYVVYLGLGLVIWNALASAALSAPGLLKNNAGNLKNTNLHAIFYSLEEWALQMQTFFQSFSLVLLVLCLFQPNLLLHLLVAGLLPLANLLLFIYWMPLLISICGANYEDFFQFVPIMLQLLFLLSPILYKKEALAHLSWAADFNPLYRILSNLRHALIEGSLQSGQSLVLLLINVLGILFSVWLLERQRYKFPFLA